MSSTDHVSETFRQLRPLCVEIAREPTSCKIDALCNYLQSHQSSNYTSLQEYIIFPLQNSIRRKNTSMDLKVRAINCICMLLSQTGITRFEIFQEIFQNVCLLLSSEDPGKVKTMSEDVKTVLVDCIFSLLNSSSPDVLGDMYDKSFMPSVGHCISLLLHIIENDKAKQLRVKAIMCIRRFVFICEKDECKSCGCFQRHEKLLSMKLASFLPGISISLCKTITRGINQGQSVLTAALEAWMYHIQVVMNDQYLPVDNLSNSVEEVVDLMSKLMPQKESGDFSKANHKPVPAERGLEPEKDKEWFSNTASKLKLLIERVVGLAGHTSWKVRLALLHFSEVLLKNCCRSLENCVPFLIEIVIGFLSDEYSQISGRSKEIMDELSMLLTDNDQPSLIQLVEENLYTLFRSLPRQIRTTEEEKKLHTLHVIVGYLHLIGSHMKTILTSGHLLKKLSHSLIQVLEFDLSDIKIVEQKVLQNTGTQPFKDKHFGVAPNTDLLKQLSTCQSIYKKTFKHFRDEKVLDAVIRICWYLGCYGDVVLVVDHFLDLFRTSTTNRKQITFLINEIVLGVTGNQHCDGLVIKEFPKEHLGCLRTCVTLILSEYLSRDVWNVRISNYDEDRLISRKEDLLVLRERKLPGSQRSFSELNSNVQLLCLLLEGIGIFAILLREHFDGMLLDVLYPLMEKLGGHNATVSEMAYWSLVTIAATCKYNSVEELIGKNVDYLINSISLNLRHISLHPDTPVVLSAMLQYGNKGLIPYLQDSLDEVLGLIDYSSDEFLFSLIKVLNSVTVAVDTWFPSSGKSPENLKEFGKRKSVQTTKLREFFVSQMKLKKTSLGEVSDEDLETESADVNATEYTEDEGKTDVKEVPQHITFAEQVLEKCSHFMASKFVKVRLVVLDTVEHGVLALAGSENRLLPMIHKLWQPMVKRFTDDELVVRTRAVSVLGIMVNTSGQFMRRRVIKDAFPALTSFLVKQQTVSLKAGPIYCHTQGFKFQLAILKTVVILCRDLDISGVDCDEVVSCIVPYLSQRQPRELQQAAVDALEILIELEPDLIWLSLRDLHCPPLAPPPTSVFPTIQFASGSYEKNEYAMNVVKLLKEYE